MIIDKNTTCPRCFSNDVTIIPKEEKVGFYAIYDFIGGIDKAFKEYRCEICGHEW